MGYIRSTTLAATSAVALITPLLLGAAPAGAATPEQACWSEVDTGLSLCADTSDELAEQMLAVYGITLAERPGEPLPDSIASASKRALAKTPTASVGKRTSGNAVQATAASSTYLLAKIYDNTSYKGSSKTFTVSLQSEPCNFTGNYAYGQEERLWVYGWNDRVRSFQVAAKCRLALYSNERMTGTKWGPKHDSKSLGIMDRAASSFSIQK